MQCIPLQTSVLPYPRDKGSSPLHRDKWSHPAGVTLLARRHIPSRKDKRTNTVFPTRDENPWNREWASGTPCR